MEDMRPSWEECGPHTPLTNATYTLTPTALTILEDDDAASVYLANDTDRIPTLLDHPDVIATSILPPHLADSPPAIVTISHTEIRLWELLILSPSPPSPPTSTAQLVSSTPTQIPPSLLDQMIDAHASHRPDAVPVAFSSPHASLPMMAVAFNETILVFRINPSLHDDDPFRLRAVMVGHKGPIPQLAFGAYPSAFDLLYSIAPSDNLLKVWNTKTREIQWVSPVLDAYGVGDGVASGSLTTLCPSPDQNAVAVGTSAGHIYVFGITNVDDDQESFAFSHIRTISTASILHRASLTATSQSALESLEDTPVLVSSQPAWKRSPQDDALPDIRSARAAIEDQARADQIDAFRGDIISAPIMALLPAPDGWLIGSTQALLFLPIASSLPRVLAALSSLNLSVPDLPVMAGSYDLLDSHAPPLLVIGALASPLLASLPLDHLLPQTAPTSSPPPPSSSGDVNADVGAPSGSGSLFMMDATPDWEGTIFVTKPLKRKTKRSSSSSRGRGGRSGRGGRGGRRGGGKSGGAPKLRVVSSNLGKTHAKPKLFQRPSQSSGRKSTRGKGRKRRPAPSPTSVWESPLPPTGSWEEQKKNSVHGGLHTMAITGIRFGPKADVLLTSSLDCTLNVSKLPLFRSMGESVVNVAGARPWSGASISSQSTTRRPLLLGVSDTTLSLWEASSSSGITDPLLNIGLDVLGANIGGTTAHWSSGSFFGPDSSRLLLASGGNTLGLLRYKVEFPSPSNPKPRFKDAAARTLGTHVVSAQSIVDVATPTPGATAFCASVWVADSTKTLTLLDIARGCDENAVVSSSVVPGLSRSIASISVPDLTLGPSYVASGSVVCVTGKDSVHRMIDMREGGGGASLELENSVCRKLTIRTAFSPCGTFLASGSEDKAVYVYDLRRGSTPLAKLRGHSDAVGVVAFNPLHPQLVSGGMDGRVKFWAL